MQEVKARGAKCSMGQRCMIVHLAEDANTLVTRKLISLSMLLIHALYSTCISMKVSIYVIVG